ncbi:hypothetical protein EXU85_15155 [Spirosoma sp. KCTC 42546]|uniref:DUF6807 domain-containing protein n=1 Tax=Spirosoma sp. KCTC 42546 TaxID=2520506 RepID=UPI001158A81E|nr:PmoA family protein [Spirosoma sp. KCTC 42546]QDK79877.1 hypothetical protein EXU85_15155 [Spirosoma sp. KCTC 42546]
MHIGRGLAIFVLIMCSIVPGFGQKSKKNSLEIVIESDTSFSIYKGKVKQLVLTQVAKPTERPYIHPIMAPDGQSPVTEFRPNHHLHQTGLFWGLKRVNGRDYFMKWKGDYWKRVSTKITKRQGKQVAWQTVYNVLDSTGQTALVETQNWTFQEVDGKFVLDFEWKGQAQTDVTMGKFYVGGLFIRMPWTKDLAGEVINASGQINKQAEAQKSDWLDVGIQRKGRSDMAHFTLLDNPQNNAFPTPWRVDNEFGVGPSRQIMEDWSIAKGATETIRYRILIYTGLINQAQIRAVAKAYQQRYAR